MQFEHEATRRAGPTATADTCLCLVYFPNYHAKTLARKNVHEVTYFVSSWRKNLACNL